MCWVLFPSQGEVLAALINTCAFSYAKHRLQFYFNIRYLKLILSFFSIQTIPKVYSPHMIVCSGQNCLIPAQFINVGLFCCCSISDVVLVVCGIHWTRREMSWLATRYKLLQSERCTPSVLCVFFV